MTFIKIRGSVDPKKEEYYKKKKEKRECKEKVHKIIKIILVIIVVLLLLVNAVLLDMLLEKNISYYKINIKEEYHSLFDTVFGVQASISTLTIAIIAIFSGFMKEKVYGISIIKYILFRKYYHLSIYNISIFMVLMILAYLLFLLLKCYFLCFLIFIITILGVLYIMQRAFKLLANYDKVEIDIKEEMLQQLKKQFNSLNYTDDGEENISYILEENYHLKDIHLQLEKYICDLYDDTVLKINIEDFNNYQKNVKIFVNIISSTFDIINMNRIKEDIYETLMQRVYSLFGILVRKSQINLAFNLVGILSEKVQFIVQKNSLKEGDKEILIRYFNIDSYIDLLLDFINKQYKFNEEYVDIIKRLIFNKSYFYLNYLEVKIQKEDYDVNRIYRNIIELWSKYFISIKTNRYFTQIEKSKSLEILEKYEEEYNKPNTYWGHFLDYTGYLLTRNSTYRIDDNGRMKIEDIPIDTSSELYIKIKKEVENIKRKLLIDIPKIIKKMKFQV